MTTPTLPRGLTLALLLALGTAWAGSDPLVDRARQSGAYVFAEFTSENCPMCQEMVPVIESVLAEHPQVQRVVHDADLEVDLAKKYGVRCVPVYVIVAPSGEIQFNDVGMRSADELRTILRDAGVTNP